MNKILCLLLVFGLCLGLVGCSGADTSLETKYSRLVDNANQCINEISKSEGMQEEKVELKYKDVNEAEDLVEITYTTPSELSLKVIYTKNEEFDKMILLGNKDKVHNNNEFPAIMLGMSELSFFEFSTEDINSIISLLNNEGTVRSGYYRVSLSSTSDNLEFKIVN